MGTQRIIGLTGGIATGKSTVSAYLAAHHGLPVLDADVYARQAVAVGSPILGAISHRYGTTLLNPDGSLNRQQLGEIVFHNVAEKQWLESQIHPYVRTCFASAMEQLPDQTVVQTIPLLFEANLTDQVTEIWVVTCDPSQQLDRLMQRNHLTHEQAQARIASQMPLAQKVAQADVVLNNSGDRASLFQQVDAALK
jgi:dephospho-CoA kinase